MLSRLEWVWKSSSRSGVAGRRGARKRPSSSRKKTKRGLWAWAIEALEVRELLATIGADYQLSGFRWSNPERITYSIAPDGVFWDHGTNQLHSTLDASLGDGKWEREVARALATWQAVANINIVPVGDSKRDLDAPGLAQGDSRFGDIRIGGYTFPGNTTTLAETYFPPPNGTTSAGDVVLNTGLTFRIGADFDLFSVLLHETGHSLGLDHPTDPSEVLNARYGGVRSGLSEGDLVGIQAIYGPRQPDSYRQSGLGSSVSSTIDVTPSLNGAGQATLAGVSLAKIGETEYFSVVAPASARGALRVTAMASGVSLLSPKVSLFDPSGRLLAANSNPAAWSNDVTAEIASVVPGQRYVVAVTGATSDVFSVGDYALRMVFDGVSPVSPPRTPTAPPPLPPSPVPPPIFNPFPIVAQVAPDRFESNADRGGATPLGSISRAFLADLTLHTPEDTDFYVFLAGSAGVYNIGAAGTSVRVLDASGRLVSQGTGQVSIRVNRASTTIYVEVFTTSGSPIADYDLSINSTPTTSSVGSPWNRWVSWRTFNSRRWTPATRALTDDAPAAPASADRDGWIRLWAFGRPAAA